MKGQSFGREFQELELAGVLSENKGFLKCVNSKRRSKEDIGLMLLVRWSSD